VREGERSKADTRGSMEWVGERRLAWKKIITEQRYNDDQNSTVNKKRKTFVCIFFSLVCIYFHIFSPLTAGTDTHCHKNTQEHYNVSMLDDADQCGSVAYIIYIYIYIYDVFEIK